MTAHFLRLQVQARGDSVTQGPSTGDLEALRALHDIVVPEAIAYTPQTIGWYLLLAVVLGVGVVFGVLARRRHVRNRYRREALGQLVVIERDLGSPDARTAALTRIPVLLKRVAISVTERTEAASLTGDAWLAFLDQAYGGSGFQSGAGRLLPMLAYAPPGRIAAVTNEAATDLVELTRTWIQSHDLSPPKGA